MLPAGMSRIGCDVVLPRSPSRAARPTSVDRGGVVPESRDGVARHHHVAERAIPAGHEVPGAIEADGVQRLSLADASDLAAGGVAELRLVDGGQDRALAQP